MIGGDSMDKDKELELLMDIQEKVGRIDERLKKEIGRASCRERV